MPKVDQSIVYFKCQIFGIMLYLVPNLASYIAFVKFNAKFDSTLKNVIYTKISNFSIDTQI